MRIKLVAAALLATYFSLLAAGQSWLITLTQSIRLDFVMRNQLHRILTLLFLAFVLRYFWKSKKEDELPIILGIVGSFLIFIGSLIGPSVVVIGLLVLLVGLYVNQSTIRL